MSLVLTSFEEIKVDSMFEGKVKGIKCWKVLKADRQTGRLGDSETNQISNRE